MIEALNNTLLFRCHYIASKVGKTGLTVTVDVYGPADTLIVTSGSATEIGGGFYKYNLSASLVLTAGAYLAVFKTSDSTVDTQHLAVEMLAGATWVQQLLALASTTVTFTSPVNASGDLITITRGDDYYQADSRQLAFTLSGFPSITGATLTFTAKDGTNTTVISKACVVTSSTAFYLELTSTNTTQVAGVRAYRFDIEAVLANGHKVTVKSGFMTVLQDVT